MHSHMKYFYALNCRYSPVWVLDTPSTLLRSELNAWLGYLKVSGFLGNRRPNSHFQNHLRGVTVLFHPYRCEPGGEVNE
jgi:hypothetical protein